MTRAGPALRTAVLLAAAACSGGDGPGDRHDRGPDPHTGTTPETGTTDTTDPTDTDSADPTAPIPPEDGDVTVAYVTSAAGDEAWFLGRFQEELAAPVPALSFAFPSGPDTCASTLYTLADLAGGVAGRYQAQQVGALSLAAPGVDVRIAPDPSAAFLYYATLDAASFPFGSTFSIAAPGDSYPALDLPDAIAIGPAWTLRTPADGFQADGPLALRWSGGGPRPLRLRLEASADDGSRGLIICDLENDGAFEVPGALVDTLPAGFVSLHLEQADTVWHDVDGRHLRATGTVVTIRSGIRP